MAFKTPPTKAELREQLREDVDRYLTDGGRVKHVENGVSGRDDAAPVKKVFFDTPREPRTYLNEVVASIDARRKPANPAKTQEKPKRPRLKTLYDDFGEPLRKIWVEE